MLDGNDKATKWHHVLWWSKPIVWSDKIVFCTRMDKTVLSASAKATLKRIEERRFTEADVRTIFIEMREHLGPLIREIGDLIAHPKRDRGLAFDFLVRGYAQMSLGIKYTPIGENTQFPIDGTCDWWLKRYLLEQSKLVGHKDIKKTLSVSPKSIYREIIGYFPNEDFPIKLSKSVDQRFIDILHCMTKFLVVQTAIDLSKLEREMAGLFNKLGLKDYDDLIDDFIVCMCIMFHQTEFELPFGNKGKCKLFIKPRSPETFERDGQEYVKTTEHGMFEVNAATVVSYKSSPISAFFPLLITTISTDQYVDESLIVTGEHGFRRINLQQNLQFDRNFPRPVKAI